MRARRVAARLAVGIPAAFASGLLICLPAAANTYRWVDAQGRVHYSDKPPLQVTEPDILDQQGRLLRPSRPQAPRAKAEVRDITRERLDRALLSTYVNETEIDLARERALAHERARQQSLEALLEQARSRKTQIERMIAAHRQAGRSPPPNLAQSLAEIEREIARLGQMQALSLTAQHEIAERYEGYKRRFRELKGLPAEAAPTPAPKASTR